MLPGVCSQIMKWAGLTFKKKRHFGRGASVRAVADAGITDEASRKKMGRWKFQNALDGAYSFGIPWDCVRVLFGYSADEPIAQKRAVLPPPSTVSTLSTHEQPALPHCSHRLSPFGSSNRPSGQGRTRRLVCWRRSDSFTWFFISSPTQGASRSCVTYPALWLNTHSTIWQFHSSRTRNCTAHWSPRTYVSDRCTPKICGMYGSSQPTCPETWYALRLGLPRVCAQR
jgi:hypothetical protein